MKTIEELKREQNDAKTKLHELVELINSEEYYALNPLEKGLISQQRTGLELYLSSLTKWIYGKDDYTDTNNLIWLSMLYGMMNTSPSYSPSSSTYLFKDIPESKQQKDDQEGREETI